ncbi:MAG: DUF6515 family protein [Mucilaginibacter sp.]
MKSLSKYLPGLALSGLLSFTLIPSANAQRGFHSGGVHISAGSGFGGFGGGLFRGALSFGLRGAFIGNRFFYGYPTIGFHLGLLPFGYYPFYWGSDLYYYSGGVFYRPYDDGGYEVTVPPVGAVVPDLPKGAKSIVINGQQYYEFNGVYFQATVDDKGKTTYVVAGKDGVLNTGGDADNPPAPQVGDVVNELPEGCKKVTLNNKKYYVAPDGIYYEDFTDNHNFKAFRIASIPSNDDQDEHQQ